MHTLACILAERESWPEARKLATRFLHDDAFVDRTFRDILRFFELAIASGQARDAAAVLRQLDRHERWQPLYEALLAAADGSAERLLLLPPEVSQPARELLTQLAPDLPGAPSKNVQPVRRRG